MALILVALLAEGVDRNFQDLKINDITPASPSSRRAWIEISDSTVLTMPVQPSPSSRRAWIEIPLPAMQEMLHPESPSSRRAWIEIGW